MLNSGPQFVTIKFNFVADNEDAEVRISIEGSSSAVYRNTPHWPSAFRGPWKKSIADMILNARRWLADFNFERLISVHAVLHPSQIFNSSQKTTGYRTIPAADQPCPLTLGPDKGGRPLMHLHWCPLRQPRWMEVCPIDRALFKAFISSFPPPLSEPRPYQGEKHWCEHSLLNPQVNNVHRKERRRVLFLVTTPIWQKLDEVLHKVYT